MTDERKLFEKKFHSLYNQYHQKKSGFKIKEAIFLNQQKIQIFKGEDFIKFTTSNFTQLEPLVPERQKDSQSLARYLIENKIILRLDRHPEDPQKRWPRKLVLIKNQTFAEEGFYTWNIVVKNKMNNVKMTIILLLVFLVCLYPIWPFAFKYGIFKLTLYLCVFFTGLLVVRFVVYIISRLFGYSFWILPNINDDTQGILGSFKPLYSIYKFTDGTLEIILRLIGIISFIGLIYFIIQEPQYITGFQEASGQTIDDILDWGKEKLEGKQEPLHRRAIPDLSDLMKEAEEFNLTEGVDVNSTLDNATQGVNETQSDL